MNLYINPRLHFFLFTFSIITYGQKPHITFEHLTIDDGLSANYISAFHKDKSGFLWMGSSNGLDKYDGYTIINYNSKLKSKNAEFLKNINNINADNDGNLWISSPNALSKFHLKTEKFTHYFNNKIDSIRGTNDILFDSTSNCIFGFSSNGKFFKLNLRTKKYHIYAHDPLNPNSIPSNGIMDIKLDKKQNLYLTFWANGLSRYNRKTDDFTNFLHNENDKNSASKYSIFGLSSDENNNIWSVSSDEVNIQKFDPKTNKFKHITPPKEISTYSNNGLIIDKLNNLWISNSHIGILYYNSKKNIFNIIKHESDNPESLSESRSSNGMYIDYENNLWISTLNKGVNKLNLDLQGVQYFPIQNKYLRLSTGITHYLEDIDKNKWVCNEDGVFKLNKTTNEYTKVDLPKAERFSRLIDLYNGTILANAENSIYLIDSKTLKSKKIELTINGNKINVISNSYLDSKKRLWVVFKNSLCMFENGIFGTYLTFEHPKIISQEQYFYTNFKEINDKLYFSNEQYLTVINLDDRNKKEKSVVIKLDGRTTSIYYTKDSIYITGVDGYVSTDFGLNSFNKHSYPFLSLQEVVPYSYFYNDSMQCFTTYRGIYLYNIRTKKYIHPKIFNPDKINPDLFFKNKNDNTFSLAAGAGFIKFDPQSLEKTAQKPIIVLSGFYLFNKEIEIGTNDSPLKESITYATEITLNHKQNVFSIELTVLNFDEVHKNQYAYKLEGFDKNWNHIGSRKVASFTNLSAGKYIFKYRGKNKNGTFSDDKSLIINILPPFWETWWFRIISLLLFFGLIYFIYWYRTRTILKQKIELEHQVILRTAEILAQNEEISAQRDAIEEHQKVITELFDDIKDSITTAQRIQESILPSEDLIKHCLPNSFVIYLPKDIVSGDLYWFHVDVNHYYIVAIDCTGHGVAGAFMSLIAHNLLNKIIDEDANVSPKQMLDRLNSYLIQLLHQESENAVSKDGMDASICKIMPNENRLEFAGANNALYYIRNGVLEQIKADKNSVGIQPMGKVAHFENHTFEFKKDDLFYLFSDGFVGQFGGIDGQEKMKFNRFRQVILDNHTHDLTTQKQNITSYLNQFKGNTEQTDDILLIGFKL